MNKSLSKFLQLFIPLALGVLLIWYFYSKFTPQQWNELVFHFKNANYLLVTASVLMSVLSHGIRAYRWNFMLEPLGYKPKLLNNFFAVSTAYFMNLFIPKSGEVSRAVVLDKYEKVPFEKGFGTIISERVVDLFFLFLFTILAVLLQFDVLFDYISKLIPFSKLLIILCILFLGLVVFYLFLKKSNGFLASKIKTFARGLKEGVFSILKMKKKGAFIFHSLIIWGLYLFSFYTATLALPETSTISFGIIIITFVVGSFTFAFTNSGLGYYPLAIAGILLLFGIPETAGTALGWIVWTSNVIYIVVSGILSLVFLPIYNRKK
ncbi:MAG: lysylphosphatidylglycerol synthase transmembrane domain-containing protein [Flavobacteriaceae bacterium]